MNWYKRILLAQIWNTDSDGSFEDELKAIYELEYKLQAVRNWKFLGMPQRRDNIISNLSEELEMAIEEVKVPLLFTFEKWLNSHALIKPETWAAERTNPDYLDSVGNEEESLKGAAFEYAKYKTGNPDSFDFTQQNESRNLAEMLAEAFKNINEYPSLQRLHKTLVLGDKERLTEELFSEGLETFGERQIGEPFASEEAAEAWISDKAEEVDILDYVFNFGAEGILSALSYAGVYFSEFLKELYQNIVFPLWFNYWKAMGIEGAREVVQEAFDMLSDEAPDIGQKIQAINHAIDTTHQTGDMIEYLEMSNPNISPSSVRAIFDDMSEGTDIPEWNQELKEIGVTIPKAVSQV